MSTSTDDTQNDTERNMSPQLQLKLVLLGESAVGKTSFLHRFVNEDFTEKREPTVGAGFLTKTYRVDDRLMKLNCWDTAGQERFHSLAPMYYRGAQAAIVMYDVTKQATFAKAKNWIRELQRQAPPHIVIALVGNKIDLCESISSSPEQQQHQEEEEGQQESTLNDQQLQFADHNTLHLYVSQAVSNPQAH
ncbi:hypothetical protein [Absidia glauca]|uniref:Uncharacterized protein n=1 Tax=Absidia glauca TaxID=4829 RepID=A0A168NXR7_ABSGL|nr:hypothetical protein [Absidia glauca]